MEMDDFGGTPFYKKTLNDFHVFVVNPCWPFVDFSPYLETASVKYVNFKMWYKTIDETSGHLAPRYVSLKQCLSFCQSIGSMFIYHILCLGDAEGNPPPLRFFFSNQYSYITLGISAGIANHWVYESICDIHRLKCMIGRHKLTSKVMSKNQLLPIAGLCLRLNSLGVDSWFYGVRLPLLY